MQPILGEMGQIIPEQITHLSFCSCLLIRQVFPSSWASGVIKADKWKAVHRDEISPSRKLLRKGPGVPGGLTGETTCLEGAPLEHVSCGVRGWERKDLQVKVLLASLIVK